MGVAEEQADLVQRARAGDREARGALYDLLARDVQRCVCALNRRLPHSEVEDAVQETFLRLFAALERYEGDRPLRPFALGIARRVTLELGRRGRRSAGEPEELAQAPSSDTPAPERAQRAEERRGVQAALESLDDELRAALSLRHTQRLTMRELATSLECSVPTARQRLRKAARLFAGELRRRGVIAIDEEVS